METVDVVNESCTYEQSASSLPDNDGLKVVDLRKSFTGPDGQKLKVLRGVSLSVEPGESVAITGASGSGKSTLLQLAGGLDNMDHGSVSLGGIEVNRLEPGELPTFRRQHIGFVFQSHYLLTDLSAVENVALPLLIARKGSAFALNSARQLLVELGLADRLDHQVSRLSGGEQQRVALARAFIGGPKLLLADEPTGNLDAAMSREIGKTLINYAHTNGQMVVLATHNQEIAHLCDRVMVLKYGRISPA